MNPAATLVVSTYNRPQSLELVLAGFARQSFQDFELIIADSRRLSDPGQPRLPIYFFRSCCEIRSNSFRMI